MKKIKEREAAFKEREQKFEEQEKRLQNQPNNMFDFMKFAGINEAKKNYE